VVAAKKWRDAIVTPTITLRQAIEKLDATALQILLVTDSAGVLKGTLTDGDLRRAILTGKNLDDTIDSAMNPNPKVASTDWSKIRLLAMMEEGSLLQLPVVDEGGHLVDLVTLQVFLQHRASPILFS
jgi:FOG: CBS domain